MEKITVPLKRILPPALKDTGKEEYETEIRLHPLLKWFWAAVATARADYKPYIIPDGLVTDLMTPRIHSFTDPEKFTPKDPVYGHLRVNDAVCFPNLWSWTKIGIVRITASQQESHLKLPGMEDYLLILGNTATPSLFVGGFVGRFPLTELFETPDALICKIHLPEPNYSELSLMLFTHLIEVCVPKAWLLVNDRRMFHLHEQWDGTKWAKFKL